MARIVQKITPCLWFDNQAAEAAAFYTSLFKRSDTHRISRYGKEGYEIHHMPDGSVMTVEFELEGQSFVALNGGPLFKFTEAISFQISCETQAEVDYFWEGLARGGDEKAQQCGWLKDQFSVSWQIIPIQLADYIGGPDEQKAQRAMKAMLQMKKIDMEEIKKAYDGLA
jgi:predicted 3-demethylubiquinone-9 3-methyltransferase (glyoxalase superfamily)